MPLVDREKQAREVGNRSVTSGTGLALRVERESFLVFCLHPSFSRLVKEPGKHPKWTKGCEALPTLWHAQNHGTHKMQECITQCFHGAILASKQPGLRQCCTKRLFQSCRFSFGAMPHVLFWAFIAGLRGFPWSCVQNPQNQRS